MLGGGHFTLMVLGGGFTYGVSGKKGGVHLFRGVTYSIFFCRGRLAVAPPVYLHEKYEKVYLGHGDAHTRRLETRARGAATYRHEIEISNKVLGKSDI